MIRHCFLELTLRPSFSRTPEAACRSTHQTAFFFGATLQAHGSSRSFLCLMSIPVFLTRLKMSIENTSDPETTSAFRDSRPVTSK